MRPAPAVAFTFALAILISSSLQAQTAPPAAAPQTARQALIEMFFGQAPDHLEKHLPDITRRSFQKLGGASGQSSLGALSLLATQAKTGKEKFETFDTGSTLLTIQDPPGKDAQRVEITVERDDLSGESDEIELAFHMTQGGKEQVLPFIPRFTFTMKMEGDIWRLNEIGVSVRLPLTDPDFLKGIEERGLHQNEQMALWSMRSVVSAGKSYQSANGSFACTLAALGDGKQTGGTRRGFLYDPELASGKKNGYIFAISGCDAAHYQVVAEPAVQGSGQRAYCSDESGTVRASADGKAATCLGSGEVVEDNARTTSVELAARPARGTTSGTTSAATSGATQTASSPAQRVRVSQGVAQGLKISDVPPVYPPEARSARIAGTVVMKALINRTGEVENLELISGHPMLAPAAMEAVKQWKYRPYLLNGNAVVMETQIQVNFTLREQ